MASWAVELRDRGGLVLADVTVPFKVRRGLNEAAHVSFTVDHEDEVAYKLLDELTRGIPQIAAYRDGVLWARGAWWPMEETAEDATQMACVFRGPFAELEHVDRPQAWVELGSRDQAEYVWINIVYVTTLRQGQAFASVVRYRAYAAGKNQAEAIMQLTEVINGVEFVERPAAALTHILSTGATAPLLADLDVGGQGAFGTDKSASVIFEHGFGAHNARGVKRQLGRPVNYVRAQGASSYVVVQDGPSQNAYGLHTRVLSLTDVSETATLTEHAQGALEPGLPVAVEFTPDASGDLQPQPDPARQTSATYWLGDTVRLAADRDALQVDMTARVRAIEIAVDQDETHVLEIGDRRVKPLIDRLRGLTRDAASLTRTAP